MRGDIEQLEDKLLFIRQHNWRNELEFLDRKVRSLNEEREILEKMLQIVRYKIKEQEAKEPVCMDTDMHRTEGVHKAGKK